MNPFPEFEDLDNPACVPNLQIHKKARGITKDEFLRRVSKVRAIRRHDKKYSLSWYPTNVNEWLLWEGIFNATRKGDFSNVALRDDYYPIGIVMSKKLLNLFSRNDLGVIHRQIIMNLAVLWFEDSAKEEILIRQLYDGILPDVKAQYDHWFKGKVYESDEEFFTLVKNAYIDFSGSPPFEFFDRSNEYSWDFDFLGVCKKWWINQSAFSVRFDVLCFSDLDWKTMIIEETPDNVALEKDDIYSWELWLHEFQRRGKRRSEAKIIADSGTRGFIYLIKEAISNNYKIGWTEKDPEKRLASLQTGNPNELILIGYFPVASQAGERALHKMFSTQRMQGEWFRLTDTDVESILDEKWRSKELIH